MRDKLAPKGRCGTKPRTLLSHQIPIKDRSSWDITRPGFIEADTVAHCGGLLKGNFAWSLTLSDIETTWKIRAVWNKGSYGVMKKVQDIEEHLPFPVVGFNSDSGGEFINHHLIRYSSQSRGDRTIKFSRLRPYKKNDNAYVEQKIGCTSAIFWVMLALENQVLSN
jgi:hypothetical protein